MRHPPAGLLTYLCFRPVRCTECSDFVTVAEAEKSWQEVFSRARLREVVTSYWKDSNPTAIRKAIAGEDIWAKQTYRTPSKRIQIVHRPSGDDDSAMEVARQAAAQDGAFNSAAADTKFVVDTPLSPVAEPASETASLWAYPKVQELIANYHGGTQDSAADEDWLKQVEGRCKGALQQFQLQSKLLAKSLTPNAALLKFQGSANLTVEQVLRRRSEFLTTHGLNVISVRAEPGVVPSPSLAQTAVFFICRTSGRDGPPTARTEITGC